jgi:hypothetical protein
MGDSFTCACMDGFQVALINDSFSNVHINESPLLRDKSIISSLVLI